MDYRELLNSGRLYDSVDGELIEYQHRLVRMLNEFNATPETQEGLAERERILKEAVGTYGGGSSSSRPCMPTTGCGMCTSGRMWW